MKRLVIAFVMMAGSWTSAFAQDELAVLPSGVTTGSPIYWNWSGVYFGAHAGYSFANAGFANSTNDLISLVLQNLDAPVSNWPTLANQDTSGSNYGGFVGFNTQWADVIVGLEANYSRPGLEISSSDSVGPLLVSVSGVPSSVTVDSSASVKITDLLTLRARAGWAAGAFLPYGFVGAAFGRTDVTRYASVSPLTFPNNPQQETKNGAFVLGFSAGAGIDVALLQNVFMRAEWEYVQFPSIKGINVSINNVRAGIGIKF